MHVERLILLSEFVGLKQLDNAGFHRLPGVSRFDPNGFRDL